MSRAQHEPAPAWGARLRSAVRPAAAITVAVVLAGAVVWGVERLRDPHTLPLRAVQVEGEFRHLSEVELQQAVLPHVRGGFFTVDVARVQRAAQSLPWVQQASVRRVWPDTLQVHVVEQRAVARWGGQGLLNAEGELFRPAENLPEGLPELHGPEGREAAVLLQYGDALRLLAPGGLKVARLVQDERRAWTLELEGGVTLALGRGDPNARLARFVRVYPTVFAERAARLRAVDLRYSNGFAVRWAEDEDRGAPARRS